jgi:putative transcriptional regulator
MTGRPKVNRWLKLGMLAACLAAWSLISVFLSDEREGPAASALASQVKAKSGKPAAGKFLVADRTLIDPNFTETVVLLLDYNDEGAMGLIVNRQTSVKLAELLPEMKVLQRRQDAAYVGGPVQQDGILLLVRSKEDLEGATRVFGDVHVSASHEFLAKLASESADAERFRAFVGYAGWASGQLEREIATGSWHILPGDTGSVFDPSPEGLWERLIKKTQLRWVWNAERKLAAHGTEVRAEQLVEPGQVGEVGLDAEVACHELGGARGHQSGQLRNIKGFQQTEAEQLRSLVDA